MSFFAMLAVALAPAGAGATTVSPPIVELDLSKGSVVEQVIKLKNDGEAPQSYYISTQRFIAAPSGEGAPEFIEGPTSIGLVSWIEFPFTQITLQSDQTIEIPLTIRVPDNAAPGGHYAGIFFSTDAPEPEDTGVGVAQRIGTLMLVRIAGQIRESAQVTQFGTDQASYDSLPVTFEATVNNLGNVHIKPQGVINIRNFLGKKAAVMAVNEAGGNILPDSSRTFEAVWAKSFDVADGNGFWAKYRAQKKNFAFGKYTADLSLAYGTNKSLSANTSFWVFPTQVIVVQLILWIIIIILIVFGLRKYNDWLISRYEMGKVRRGKKK